MKSSIFSKRRLGIGLVVVLLCAAALWRPRPNPDAPIKLHLKLAKNRIKTGEFLWYLLEAENVGHKPVRIKGCFWKTQIDLLNRNDGTRLDIFGPDGKKVWPRHPSHGYGGALRFWTNDGGDGKPYKFTSVEDCFADLKGGETLAATPSIIAPVRERGPNSLPDDRALPHIPEGMSKEALAALRRDWKETVEGKGYVMGDLTFRPDPKEPAVSRPKGYRVLDVYDFNVPGKYRMRFVYRPLDGSSLEIIQDYIKINIDDYNYPTLGKIEDWINRLFRGSDYVLHDYLRSEGWPKETRTFRYMSNWVQFEVEAVPFPERLFRPRSNETAKQRRFRAHMKRLMRESFIWEKKLEKMEK